MRDLDKDELGSVYGAGGYYSWCRPKKDNHYTGGGKGGGYSDDGKGGDSSDGGKGRKSYKRDSSS